MEKKIKIIALLCIGCFSVFHLINTRTPTRAEETKILSKKTEINRSLKTMVELAKTDKTIVLDLETKDPNTQLIEYQGGYFTSVKADEPFVVEILSPDEKTVVYRDDEPTTVGEVLEAIQEKNK
ncbi:hypothetical protein [Streptococcus sp. 20-1249]|uniref:hypothetical protein n=1 Tax=Streptococcus hepaticus TaxID=3349163 RepID=UPI0037485A3D